MCDHFNMIFLWSDLTSQICDLQMVWSPVHHRIRSIFPGLVSGSTSARPGLGRVTPCYPYFHSTTGKRMHWGKKNRKTTGKSWFFIVALPLWSWILWEKDIFAIDHALRNIWQISWQENSIHMDIISLCIHLSSSFGHPSPDPSVVSLYEVKVNQCFPVGVICGANPMFSASFLHKFPFVQYNQTKFVHLCSCLQYYNDTDNDNDDNSQFFHL